MADVSQWEQVFQQAVELHSQGKFDEGGELFAAILEQHPGHFPSLHRLAAIRRHQGKLEESLALLKQAIGCNPNSADVHNSMGNTLNALGRPQEAMDQYRCALALRPDFPEAHLNLGNSLRELGRFEEAGAAYMTAIALRPQYAEAHNRLGLVHSRMNRPLEAIACYSAALSLDPKMTIAYSNLGSALTDLNRHEEALPMFRRAREIEPEAAEPAWNEALARLALGDYERAWPDYETRWRAAELQILTRDFSQPVWDGQTDIAGKTILIHAEQGLGDTVMCARYVPMVIERGARVIVEVQKPLKRLMSAIPGVAQTVAYGETLPDFDTRVSFGSLPRAFETTIDTIPKQIPYLTAPAESPALEALSASDDARPRVGICWAGNPAFPTDHNRSIPLPVFSELLRTPGIRFVSLQQNLKPGDDQILAEFGNIDLDSDRKGSGLHDTAALMSKLDLVITVDTVIGHLAGALGRPFWVLLAFYAYWPWMRYRTDSLWYPTARLFRQAEIANWTGVIERVSSALKDTGRRECASR